jgi:hypothetical protein
MAKKKTKTGVKESDGSYVLKLVLYAIVGSQWLWITNSDGTVRLGLPLGLAIGLWFASHDRFQIDRKIEYALILISMLIGFWSQTGIFINL